MSDSKLDLWDWLGLALVLGCAIYVIALIVLLHNWRDAFDLVQAWVDAFPLSPNHILPFAYSPPGQAPAGYLITRQANVLVVALVAYYLIFHIRADLIGRDPISGPDRLFGAVSIPLLPLLMMVANQLPESGAFEFLAGPVHGFISRNSLGGVAYLVGCVILANGVCYLPAFAVSRLIGRIRRLIRTRSRHDSREPGLGAVARGQKIHDIIHDPNASKLIRDAADAAVVEVSASEFLRGLLVTTGLPGGVMSNLFERYADESALRSMTTGTWDVDGPYGHCVVAFLAAIAEQNIELTHVNEERAGRKVSFAATIPSSPSSWKGRLVVELEGSALRFRGDAKVSFPGQIFAWGRGRRILSKLRRDMSRYLAELAKRRV
jgi:hypothetical protein